MANVESELAKTLRSMSDDHRMVPDFSEQLLDIADTIELQAKDLDAGRELMRQAWHEFNAIRARDGAPVGVSEEWWSQMTEELGKLLGDEAKPWMSNAAQALLAPSHAEICEVQDRAIKAEQERDAALKQFSVDASQAQHQIDMAAAQRVQIKDLQGRLWSVRESRDHARTQRDAALAEVERLKAFYKVDDEPCPTCGGVGGGLCTMCA